MYMQTFKQYLLEKEVDPSTILLTTFNVDAAEILKDRLMQSNTWEENVLKIALIKSKDVTRRNA